MISSGSITRWLPVAVAACLSTAPAVAQGRGGGQSAGGASLPARTIFLRGQVAFEDGSPTPQNVVIERVCGSRRTPETKTDNKGRFSFQVGQNPSSVGDASYGDSDFGSNRATGTPSASASELPGMPTATERELIGCEVRAVMPGYRSTAVELTGRRAMDDPDLGTLVLTRQTDVEGYTISATSMQAPKKAQSAFENGAKQVEKQNWQKAESELRKAVTEYPNYAEAWQSLGEVYEASGKPAEAREAYAKALAADDKFVSPYLNLARMDARERKWQDVIASTERVLKLNPHDLPEAYFYQAVAYFGLQNAAEAEKAAREAVKVKLQTRFPQLEQILGLSLAEQGNYKEAHEHLTKYVELVPNAANADTVRRQIAQIEQLLARTPQQ